MEATQERNQCKWISREKTAFVGPHAEKDIKFMSYNILADIFTKEEGFEYCSKTQLAMNSRHPKIVQQIIRTQPDVVCLQEVGEIHFENALVPDLRDAGYKGIRMQYKLKGSTDGLAIFYRADSMRLRQSKSCPSQENIHKQLEVSVKTMHQAKPQRMLVQYLFHS